MKSKFKKGVQCDEADGGMERLDESTCSGQGERVQLDSARWVRVRDAIRTGSFRNRSGKDHLTLERDHPGKSLAKIFV